MPNDEQRPLPDVPHRDPHFVELSLRIGALALLLYVSVILVRPFATVIIWSTVLAVALYPFYERVSRVVGGRKRLAAVIVTAISLVVVLGPAAWLVLDLIESIRRISEQLDLAQLSIPPPPISIKTWPIIGARIYDTLLLASNNLEAAVAQFAPLLKPLAGSLLLLAANAGLATVMFFASLVIAGFFFVPGPALVGHLRRILHRLQPRHGEDFVMLAGATIRSVSRGVVGVSALQALLIGVGLTVAGVPGTSLITSAALILGIVQIGAGIILIPVLVWSWLALEPTTAFLLTAYMIPVGLLDNILRPLVIGRGLKTPMLIILIGVIGGTLAYGVTGVFLGPIILAVIWDLLSVWLDVETTE
jgi:predicted PurR-regulated permease PerM